MDLSVTRRSSKAIEKFEQPEELKTVFAAHNRVASHRGVAVVEVDDVKVIQKTFNPMLDFADFTVTPLIPVFPESE